MDLLAHNTVIRVHFHDRVDFYRVLIDATCIGKVVAVRIDSSAPMDKLGGRPRKNVGLRKKPPLPSVGTLEWLEREELLRAASNDEAFVVDVEPEAAYLQPVRPLDVALFEKRIEVMRGFLSFDHLRESILSTGSVTSLIAEAMEKGISKALAYKCFSLLCRFGFNERSLMPRRYKCGAPGILRPCEPGGRRKPGRKTIEQSVAKQFGEYVADPQPGMHAKWRKLILAADRRIHNPKPKMPTRCRIIQASHFIQRYVDDGGKLKPAKAEPGTYPNIKQVEWVLKHDIPLEEQILQKTTKAYFDRSLRGLKSRGWKGVSGPGHTWAVDSTVGDIHLRSSLNRAWIIGRPILYVIVDVWSTAIVGFYLCLEGPSWDMAKLALFSAAASPSLIGELWGYIPVLSLDPLPTLPAILMCDRGEYLSQAARMTAVEVKLWMSYAPPYRPDLKGLVEVQFRRIKDQMYRFVPGAIDQRRREFELRRTRPQDSAFTIKELACYLYSLFTEYNLTANRWHRVDAHMRADGVIGSPAGLWHWGHSVGIGVRRLMSESELITSLLPQGPARVRRDCVRMSRRDYQSPVLDAQGWTTIARGDRGWDVQANYFPGSVSRIWTPNPVDRGMLPLMLSDLSTASPELTFDEDFDSYKYAKIQQRRGDHERTLKQVDGMRERERMVERAVAATSEADAKWMGDHPTLNEARVLDRDARALGSSDRPEARHSTNHPIASGVSYLSEMHAAMAQMAAEDGDD